MVFKTGVFGLGNILEKKIPRCIWRRIKLAPLVSKLQWSRPHIKLPPTRDHFLDPPYSEKKKFCEEL